MGVHDEDRPVAVRAAAFGRRTWWRSRPRRVVRYDALWHDGRVRLDVDLADVMYRGHPADFWPVHRRVHDECPEDGTGRWVDEWGSVVDGPGPPGTSEPGVDGGRPRPYRPACDRPDPTTSRAWRFGSGLAGLVLGVPLVSGVLGDGVAGPVGVVLCLFGVAALAGLRTGPR